MKYKVGDVVTVRRDLRENEDDGKCFVTYGMLKFRGQKVKIIDVSFWGYSIEGSSCFWRDYMFENVPKELKEFISKLCV